MTHNPFGPHYYDSAYCQTCQRMVTNPHFCPGPQTSKTWTFPSTVTNPNPLDSVIVTFDPEKELPGTVIFMDGVYYVKLSDVGNEYDWYSDAGQFLNATIMNARYEKAKSFEFLKRPRTNKRAVLERFLDHRDIDKALKELKDASD